MGSYGPAAGGAGAAARGGDVANEGDRLGSDDEGRAEVAAFDAAFGDDVILSASELAAFGYAACGALANVAFDVTGMDMLGGRGGRPATAEVAAGEPAAARFAEDGGAAGVRPAMATGCGVD